MSPLHTLTNHRTAPPGRNGKQGAGSRDQGSGISQPGDKTCLPDPCSLIPAPCFPGKPRILVLSVAIGTGHLRAAEAVELALRQVAPDAAVRRADVLDLASTSFRRCYGQMYLDLISLAPQVLGFFYNLMDKARPTTPNFWDRLRVSLERMSLRPFIRLLKSEPWDLLVSTHFLAAEIIASLRQERKLAAPQVVVTTDYETHRLWVNQPCEHYFAATAEAARYLHFYGVPATATSVTGIPVHPTFARPKDRALCLARQGLAGDRPVVVQLTGGHGVGPVEEVFRALLAVQSPLEVVAVTGRNARARDRLLGVPAPGRHRVKVLGFTDQIDELMAAADLLVTKPGGLTTAEALARGTPLVIIHPVPGQEERNSDFLLENGAAVKVNHLPTLAAKLDDLLADPGRLDQLKANARRLGRPRAAFEVAERCLEIALSSPPSALRRRQRAAAERRRAES